MYINPLSRLKKAAAITSLLFLPFLNIASANEGGAPAGPEPFNFVSNLGNPATGGQVLSLEVILEGASPEISQETHAFKPKIQHEIILILSDEVADMLRTPQGKKSLADKIQTAANKILKETEKTGIKEVLFTKFLIQ